MHILIITKERIGDSMTALERAVLNGLGVQCKQVEKTKFILTSRDNNRQSIVMFSYDALKKTKKGWIANVLGGRETFYDRLEALKAGASYVSELDEKK